MIETTAVRTPSNPQLIIVISASPSRQHAIKALVGVVLTDTPLNVAVNYAEAKEYFATTEHSSAMVVVDAVSLDGHTMLEICPLKKDFPETRCLLLVESPNGQRTGNGNLAFSKNLNADEVLVGSVSGKNLLIMSEKRSQQDRPWKCHERWAILVEKTHSILIVSNWQQRRLSLVSIFNTLADNSAITAVDFVHTWTNLNERQADILVVDRWSPSDDITELIRAIKQKYPGTRILVLDCFAGRSRSFNLYPADVVLESDLPPNQIVDAVRQLLSSEPSGPLQVEA